MFENFPQSYQAVADWEWAQFEPYFQNLEARPITGDNVVQWLTDRAQMGNAMQEIGSRLYVATTLDTTDEAANERLMRFLGETIEQATVADQRLKEKLLATGLEPEGFDIQLRDMRAEAELFREANVPLFTEETRLTNEYDRIKGAQTVMWEGEEKTLSAINPLLQSNDREVRERAWRAMADRQLQDRQALNDLWVQLLTLRLKIAENAGMPDYRAYIWRSLARFDYSPEDILRFHDAIEKAVVPAATRIQQRRKQQLGLDTLRPWDTTQQSQDLGPDPLKREPLKPFDDVSRLDSVTSSIFNHVDPALGDYYASMQKNAVLDLDNRKGKGRGGYCTDYPVSRTPFIFMNAVGTHDDVQTLLHEGGHAFHAFEVFKLPVYQQSQPPIEFCEVASMSMELIAAPYLSETNGGFYSDAEAARARVDHLEGLILFWPYMAVVDTFQHWVYTHPQDAMNADNCDAEWTRQWDRFMSGVDWSGLQAEKETGWHRKLHIFNIPFYYVEYGLAQLGAVQVWHNSLSNQAGAIAQYRQALALGNTVTLPKLFEAAGAKFAMDAETLGTAVALAERVITELE